jgi:putative nucleotidyltransferase with HDIG domain
MSTLRILFVDDERSLLDGLRRSMRKWSKQWDMQFVDSGNAALSTLSEWKAHVVVTDMRMPGMDGIQLLKEVKARYPHMIRFVLSGFSERGTILESMGLCHQFFSKPCDPEQLAKAIEFSSGLYQHLNRDGTQRIVGSLQTLPSPPTLYTQINAELEKEEPSILDIANLIRCDTAMSAKVLQLVNSSYFGLGEPVADIREATVFLGTDNLRALAMTVGLTQECFVRLRHAMDLDAFTEHSIQVGAAGKKLAEFLHLPRRGIETAFSAGLLHDIGKLVMATFFDSPYFSQEAVHMHTPDTEDTQDFEMQHFGENHATLGAALLAIWGIPPDIVNAVAFHHKPHLDTEQVMPFSTLVHIANAMVWQGREQSPEDLLSSNLLNREHLDRMGLSEKVSQWTLRLRELS